MKSGLYGFLFAMWVLIIIGGGIMVVLLGPFTIQQFGEFHWIIASGIKVTIALILVLGIVFLLNKIDFPAPKKEIEKIISNENFKIVK